MEKFQEGEKVKIMKTCKDIDIDEIYSNFKTIDHLITVLFLENIAIFLLLIILTW